MYKRGEEYPIIITQNTSDFDGALKKAYKEALHVFDIDESSHTIHVKFETCTMIDSDLFDYEYSSWYE